MEMPSGPVFSKISSPRGNKIMPKEEILLVSHTCRKCVPRYRTVRKSVEHIEQQAEKYGSQSAYGNTRGATKIPLARTGGRSPYSGQFVTKCRPATFSPSPVSSSVSNVFPSTFRWFGQSRSRKEGG